MGRNNFDGLRLLGAMLVLVSHQFAITGRPEPSFFTTLGGMGVGLFFGMSGYLIAGSWSADPHLLRFAARRLLRIWPAFAALVLTGWMVFTFWPQKSAMDQLMYPIAAGQLLNNLVFFLGYWDWAFFQGQPFGAWMGTAWTLPFEVALYAALAAVGMVGRRWVHVPAFILPVLAYFAHDAYTILGVLFCAGAVIYLGARWPIAAAAAVLGMHQQWGLMAQFACAVFACWAGPKCWPILRSGARFGDLSYGVYLWGWPVEQIGMMLLGTSSVWVLLPVSALGSCALALVSWHLLEKQALKLKPPRVRPTSATRPRTFWSRSWRAVFSSSPRSAR